MNTKQKYVIITATLIMVLMLLFPQFYISYGTHGTFNEGYHFITYAPEGFKPLVNIGLLLMQWVALGLVSFVAYYLFGNQR